MNVRLAAATDAAAIARVHVDSWRTAYKGIVASAFLERLSHERSQQWWENVLANPPARSCLHVLEADSEIVGFAYAGETRAPEFPYDAELSAIYILEEHQGKGGGRRLFDAVRTSLTNARFTSMLLWVLENNPSRGFYDRLGGSIVASKQDKIGDDDVTEIAYGWIFAPPLRILAF